AVFGERRRRPQLAPPFEGTPAATAQVDEPIPVACVTQSVDVADELVKVSEVDQLLAVHGLPLTRGARDKDGPSAPKGTPVGARSPPPGPPSPRTPRRRGHRRPRRGRPPPAGPDQRRAARVWP